VVVPIVAPILLADPAANITAVWFGVMVGLNIQTSFLTPPFGFSLFYLRGVAPAIVKTTQIYKGAAAFIGLQLIGLAVAGYYPSLVNYLPTRIQLTSDTAPPPTNPKLQYCLQRYVFNYYDENEEMLRSAIQQAKSLDISYLPEAHRDALNESFDQALSTFSLVENIRTEHATVQEYVPEYKPVHSHVRDINSELHDIDVELKETRQDLSYAKRIDDQQTIADKQVHIEELEARKEQLKNEIPENWGDMHKQYKKLAAAENRAVLAYRRATDDAFETVDRITTMITRSDGFAELGGAFDELEGAIDSGPVEAADEALKDLQAALRDFEGTDDMVAALGDARDELEDEPDRAAAVALLNQASVEFQNALAWRERASRELGPALAEYRDTIRGSIGIRAQKRLTNEQAKAITSCQAKHRDVSLDF
jgi:hypothetical protein